MSAAGKLSRYPWRRALLALVLIIVFGVVRMPLEYGFEKELRAAGFRDWSPNLSNREQLTQAGFVGAIGGFRSLVASVYDIKSASARDVKNWAEVEKFRNITVSLQPRIEKYWELAAWDMAWNAYAYFDRKSESYEDTFEGLRLQNVVKPAYLDKGIEFAKRGMKWLPESYELPYTVALIYGEDFRYDDKCAAVPWFYEASQKPKARPYHLRMYVHYMVLCGDMDEKAYKLASELYHAAGQPKPTLRRDMEILEDRFSRQRIDSVTPAELKADAVQSPQDYRVLATLALYHAEDEQNFEAAAEVYRRVVALPEVPRFYFRKLALSLAKNPSTQREGYRALRELLAADRYAVHREDLNIILDLEEQLEIPNEQRAFPPK